MPEPVTITVIALTAVVMGAFGYKAIDTIARAPRVTIEGAGKAAEALIKTLSAELHNLFGAYPRLSVDKVVIQKAPSAISELCLAKSEIEVTAKVQRKWMLSTKQMEACQTFVVKAGYDLNRLKLDLDTKQKRVRVTISEATIVNVVPTRSLKLKADSGWWNRVSEKDREEVINALPAKATEEAKALGIYTLAEKQLKLVLERMLGAYEVSIDVTRIDDAIVFDNNQLLRDISPEAKKHLHLLEERLDPANVANLD